MQRRFPWSITMETMTDSDAVLHSTDQWDSTAELFAAEASPTGREAMWDQARAFIDAGRHDGAHLVASVIVVDADGLVLLARHRRYPQWGPLGGHLERDDASLCAAAARELFEEAGLAANVHPSPIDVRLWSYRCRTVAEPVLHLDVQFVAFAKASAPPLVASDELTGLEWFGARDLTSLTPAGAELVGLAVAAATLRR
jgi:8-oxo-dGTP pyrophosphatase MutT (NUDIX family)